MKSAPRLTAALLLALAVPRLIAQSDGPTAAWQQSVRELVWVCYTPTGVNPDRLQQPTAASIRADLETLRRAGFTGLITYGSAGEQGRAVVPLAEAVGFRGLIVGIWDFTLAEELEQARAAARSPLVLGLCVGNEGCGKRYTLPALRAALDDLRRATGKPVTTTEEIDDYVDDELLQLGDWVFPNAHPFFHGRLDSAAAVRWTRGAYEELSRAGRFVWFKEVGLPTAGTQGGEGSETAQAEYYRALADTPVLFAYFEGFDQPWKTGRAFEAHWGLFTAERQPKQLARAFLADPPRPTTAARPPAAAPASRPAAKHAAPFYVYRDQDSRDNHFAPSGLDGDCGDIQLDEGWRSDPQSGDTCIRLTYTAAGHGPHKCSYDPPCRWASLRWLHPPGNWGRAAEAAGQGLDLTGYTRLTFWARAEQPCRVKFTVGGIDAPFGDSLAYPCSRLVQLERDWRRYTLELAGADLRHTIGGFGWDTNWDLNPQGVVIYLDEIRFE